MKDNRFKYSNFDEVFGELQSIQRVKRNKSDTIIVISALLFLLIFGIITYIASEDIWTLPCCVVIPFLLLFMVVRQIFSTKNDELKIYQNGFTYKSSGKYQTCLWSEIESFEHISSRHSNAFDIEQGIHPLESVTKKGGEIIILSDGLSGTTEIETRLKKFKKMPKKRNKRKKLSRGTE